MTELHERTAVDLRELLLGGSVSPVELTEHYLARVAARNDRLGAFATVTADAARERAAALTRERAAGEALDDDVDQVLWGLPSGDKDLWDRAGVPTGFGSRAFAGPYAYVPDVSSDVVAQLDAAGTVSLGKTAAPELGFPAYTEGLGFPPARNPWDPTRTAGGSSGGAAVAVAAGMLPFAPGSDGGGSIRIPAAACGVVGLKPTRGLLPAGGGVDSVGGLVVTGPIARTVADAALLLEGMIARGPDGAAAHPYTLRQAAGERWSYVDAATGGAGRKFRLAVSTFSPWTGFYDITPTPEALAAHYAGVTALAGLGHDLTDLVREPDATYAPAFRTLWMAGAAALPIDDPERLALLEPLTRWLVGVGRKVTARELVEALRALAAFERTTLERIAPYDAVVLPALGMVPPELGWFDAQDPERNFEQQCQFTPYTSMVNVTGLPAITVPTQWTAPTPTAPAGMPMGIQLVGRPGGEHTLLEIAAQLEDTLRWPERRPPTW
ncbi:Amidase [Xylanimonas cellulosilytica DSM 15894]|uniref:Amidase n=1 Tax=Xylanimonas cellulosilytica (strain DSM 15894 / JCM 12276 / CECT 5975 / KCTC 9989 / LMG 20990 / NBRC 107835 / XIL07) TaxID=446471 RepID=D1BZZ0_XYLCX|nr:amidase [Xylanimonas cellulosilytica]ACZ32118.1 Amidase [Xylanimonas cellulosilytica DSM 15894]